MTKVFLTRLFPIFSLLSTCLALASALDLTLSVPPYIPPLPPSTAAHLTTFNRSLSSLVTRGNLFVFSGLTPWPENTPDTTSYLLDIVCRDYDFASYGVDVKKTEAEGVVAEVYRVVRGGVEVGKEGERVKIAEKQGEATLPSVGAVELKILRVRDYYEARSGFNPASLLKSPMILIGVVGLAFVVGVPYLLENMDPETRREFEEHQKKGILGTGGGSGAAAAGGNPFQNFDMAAWMAGRQQQTAESPRAGETRDTGSSRTRRRG